MMLIGPHTRKLETPDVTRAEARSNSWGVIQTHAGNPQTLNLNPNTAGSGILTDRSGEVTWVVHAAYAALFTPPDRTRSPNTTYLTNLAEWCRRVGASYAVIHLGGTKDRDPAEVVDNAIKYFDEMELLRKFLTQHNIRFLVENVAAKYPTNSDLKHVATIAQAFPCLGWCLDLAHSNAAAVPYSQVEEYLQDPLKRPTVLHANYPGSAFGSGHDVHGWYYKDQTPVTPEIKEDWKRVIKLAHSLGIPMVMEGSSSPGDTPEEVRAIQILVLSQ
jgi:endonuclease IV